MSSPAPPLPIVHLKTERRSNHPWIFQKMVEKPAVKPRPGSIVEIRDRDGSFAGRGFYNGHSRIALRVLTADPEEMVGIDFFERRIARAIALRRETLGLDAVTDAYRLVHSEGDDLSGLVVDRFGSTIVIEFFSAGMWKQRETLRRALAGHFPDAQFYWFMEEHVAKQESIDATSPTPPAASEIVEHGIRFRVEPGLKHKTGFFADQRDNRLELSRFCAGARVLDICCNSGGFALYAALKGGAAEVTGLDLDETVLKVAEANARLNKTRVRWVQADLFAWLRDVAVGNKEQFDVVILDPAKLTRDREQVIPALKKYLDMNKLAMAAVKPGGILLTCSCTGLVDEPSFLDSIRRAAFYAGRSVQILKVSGAGPDHPWLAHVPESRYLKAVFCRVW